MNAESKAAWANFSVNRSTGPFEALCAADPDAARLAQRSMALLEELSSQLHSASPSVTAQMNIHRVSAAWFGFIQDQLNFKEALSSAGQLVEMARSRTTDWSLKELAGHDSSDEIVGIARALEGVAKTINSLSALAFGPRRFRLHDWHPGPWGTVPQITDKYTEQRGLRLVLLIMLWQLGPRARAHFKKALKPTTETGQLLGEATSGKWENLIILSAHQGRLHELECSFGAAARDVERALNQRTGHRVEAAQTLQQINHRSDDSWGRVMRHLRPMLDETQRRHVQRLCDTMRGLGSAPKPPGRNEINLNYDALSLSHGWPRFAVGLPSRSHTPQNAAEQTATHGDPHDHNTH